jgi:nucleotide-binding universal stress UspA family protein
MDFAKQQQASLDIAHLVSPALYRKVLDLRSEHRQRSAEVGESPRAGERTLINANECPVKLHQIVASRDLDLVVASSRRALDGARSLGQAVEEVLRIAQCPVLILGPAIPKGRTPQVKPRTIVHGTDFSPQALAAAQYAFSCAQEHESWLTMLHVVEGVSDGVQNRSALATPFRRWLAELVPSELPLWTEVEHRIEFGDPAEQIVRTAKEMYADLVVIGLSGMDGADGTRPGSTARQVIANAPCPVLVVRHDPTREDVISAACDRRAAVPVAA